MRPFALLLLVLALASGWHAGRPAALYKIRYTGGELMGDHEDLEAHEIEQSKPMTARELARAEKDDDDSVKSKASKFDPNEEVSDSVS